MSGVMSMFSNLFSSGAPQQPASPTPPTPPQGVQAPAGTPGNIPATAPNTGVTTPGSAPNGQLPAVSTTPLDEFKDLWQNAPVDPGAPSKSGAVFGDVDPKKFMEAAGKINFAQHITPDILQAIQQGGDGAVQALATAVNTATQGVYAQSSYAATKMIDQALAKAREQFLGELPQHIKKQNVSDTLRAENPIFSNPAVQPIISALEAQMAVKYPNASSSELTAMAKQYVSALGTSFAPKPPETQQQQNASKDYDWSTFLN